MSMMPAPSTTLTAEERAMIDAAIEAKMVKVIPRGQCGEAVQRRWVSHAIESRKSEGRKNRAKIYPLWAAGMNTHEIAAITGITYNTVHTHMTALREAATVRAEAEAARAAHSGQVASAENDGGAEQSSACSGLASASTDGDTF